MYLICYEQWVKIVNYSPENKYTAKEFINTKFVN